MKSKKIISVIMALSMVAGTFAACGDKNADTSTKTIDDINNMSEEELEAAIYSAAAAMESSAAAETTTEAEDGVQKIDIWKDIEVTFSGIEGNRPTATYSYTGDDDVLREILMDEKEGLNQKDNAIPYIIVTYPSLDISDEPKGIVNGVTAQLDFSTLSTTIRDKITAAGYELESDTSPEITISGLATLVTSFSELSDEQQQQLFDEMDTAFNAQRISEGDFVEGGKVKRQGFMYILNYTLSEIEVYPTKRVIIKDEYQEETEINTYYMAHMVGDVTDTNGNEHHMDEYRYIGYISMPNIALIDGDFWESDEEPTVDLTLASYTDTYDTDHWSDVIESKIEYDGHNGSVTDQTDWLVDTTLGSEAE